MRPQGATAKIYLRHAGRPVSDAELVAATAAELSAFAAAAPAPPGAALALVETAGGPASPGPSGRIQVACPALRPRGHTELCSAAAASLLCQTCFITME